MDNYCEHCGSFEDKIFDELKSRCSNCGSYETTSKQIDTDYYTVTKDLLVIADYKKKKKTH